MTELQDPSYLENGSHPAQTDRLVLASLVAAAGIVGEGDLLVSEKAGTPDMSVDVAAGAVFVAGTQQTHQGTYHAVNDATVNRAVAASDATNPRIDLVVARIYDAFISGATNSWAIEVVTGTAEASPSEPAVPDDSEVLARIDVPAGATAITDAEITDRRIRSSSPTGLRALVTFTAPGMFDKADYPWLRAVRVRLVGGGGGGGGAAATSSSQVSIGRGGGGGGYSERFLTVDQLASSETVTPGAGGAGGSAGGAGTTGEQSSFGSLLSGGGGVGGPAGAANTFSSAFAAPVDGGVGSGGDINTRGGPSFAGHASDANRVFLSAGGPSQLGFGAPSQVVSTSFAGEPGQDYGGGGCGGGNGASQSAVGGADGAQGIVIVELYA